MTTPVGRDIRKSFPTMGDAVVDLLLVRVGLVIGLADALGNDLGIAPSVTQILAVGTLHTSSVLQQLTTEGTAHDVVELLINEFMALLLGNNLLLLPNGTLAIKSSIVHAAAARVFDCKRNKKRSV